MFTTRFGTEPPLRNPYSNDGGSFTSPPVTIRSGDDAIQATDNDAAVSRSSAARLGYVEDPFIDYFIRRPERRSPLMNRGTYLRSTAIDRIVSQFMQLYNNKCQIVSLGASKNQSVLKYFEVDFSPVTKRKIDIVSRTSELNQYLIDPHLEGEVLNSRDYAVVSGDLRQWDKVISVLDRCGLDKSIPTLFLSECVLIYLKVEYSNYILSWIPKNMQTCLFVTYEQILPFDTFGQQMISNLQLRGIELYSLKSYPSLSSQKQRYLDCGWQIAESVDLNQIYECISNDEKLRMTRLEILDEVEEFQLLIRHYCITKSFYSSLPMPLNLF